MLCKSRLVCDDIWAGKEKKKDTASVHFLLIWTEEWLEIKMANKYLDI